MDPVGLALVKVLAQVVSEFAFDAFSILELGDDLLFLLDEVDSCASKALISSGGISTVLGQGFEWDIEGGLEYDLGNSVIFCNLDSLVMISVNKHYLDFTCEGLINDSSIHSQSRTCQAASWFDFAIVTPRNFE